VLVSEPDLLGIDLQPGISGMEYEVTHLVAAGFCTDSTLLIYKKNKVLSYILGYKES
jgi:hypothetical protein